MNICKPHIAQSDPSRCYRVTSQRNTRLVMVITLSERLIDAARCGDAVEVQQLLLDKSVDPAYINSAALYWAASNGHVRVVRLLLKDGRANPADRGSYILWDLVYGGRYETFVPFLKADATVASHYYTSALIDAARYGRLRVVKALLKDGRADPAASVNEAIKFAIRGRHTQVVALLDHAIPRHTRWSSRCGTVHTIIQLSIIVNAR